MPSRNLPDLKPEQVVPLYDYLLHNADKLLQASLAVLNQDNPALARSLAILGLEESGKAIALFNRRVRIAYAPEGEPFVDDHLREIWADHKKKLMEVHEFLVDERYWFGVEPADPDANSAYLGTIKAWASKHDRLKMRGFYVDIDRAGDVLTPEKVADVEHVAEVISHVDQIGWQLRLGEHIEAKSQMQSAAGRPASTPQEIAEFADMFERAGIAAETIASIIEGMDEPDIGVELRNDAYRLHLPSADQSPFAKLGQPGYEAETRKLRELAGDIGILDDLDGAPGV